MIPPMTETMKGIPMISCIFKVFTFFLLLSLPLSVLGISCSTEITNLADGDSGVIQSPGFPESYPQGSGYNCIYQLSIIGDGYITLSFEDFHLRDELVYTCKNNGTYDYLTINLHNNQSPIYSCSVGRPTTIIAPKDKVTIELVVHAAPSSSDTFRGFQMRYSFISEEKKLELGTNFHVERTIVPKFERDEGSFSAPSIKSLQSEYTSQSLDIIWYVTAPTIDDRIQLTVTAFFEGNINIADFYPPYIPSPMLLIADGPTSKSTALLHGVNVDNSPFLSSQRFMFVQLKGTVGAGTLFEAQFSFFREPKANGKCMKSFVRCRRSDQCIKDYLVCNERANCGRGDDEYKCNTPTTVSPPTCKGACFNGGKCVDDECQCPKDYIGSKCEYPVSIDANNPDLEHTSIMIGAFVGAVCLLSICWLVAMARKRYTDEQQPGHRPPQRMISVHTPEELGLRRSTTSGPGDLEIPPEYSEVFIESTKPILVYSPSIISSEPMSPPPSYDIVTGEEELGIVIEFPDAENSNLPDVVSQNESDNSSQSHSNTASNTLDATESNSISRQTSRSTDV